MGGKLLSVFSQIENNRRGLSKLHELNDTLIAVICGAYTWNNIEQYCQVKVDWLSNFLNLQNGISSHDSFNRVISSIDNQYSLKRRID